jgi:hypothetical protein
MRVPDPTAGFRWPVHAQRDIAAPAQEIWGVISRPGNLELCHPFCFKNPVQQWPGPQSCDAVHYLSGWIFERQFRGWFEGIGYDLEIGRSKGRKSLVSWRIAQQSDDECALGITICPHAFQHVPAAVRWFPHQLWLRPQLRNYLDSVLRGIEWYALKRRPVPKNAFGTHPWFSGRD